MDIPNSISIAQLNQIKKDNENTRVYAVIIDIDILELQEVYGILYTDAQLKIQNILSTYGFKSQQGNVYFGDSSVNAVTCVLAIQELGKRYSWFTSSIRDVRMLRIEESNDLMPAL